MNNLFLFLNYKERIRRIVVRYENEDSSDLKRLRHLFGSDIVINQDAKSYIENNII